MVPNLIVIGAMKCGTSSLHYYLGLHPEIETSKKKELDFFIHERNWNKGISWYESNFSDKGTIHAESSPNYTKYPWFKGVAQRMYSVVPKSKLIYILRDPIERIVSEYVHIHSQDGDRRTITEALTDLKNNWYVDNSKYYMQLERYLNFYPRSSVLILTAEELSKDPGKTLKQVFRFLGVDDSFHSPGFSKKVHVSRDIKVRNRLGRLLAKGSGHRKPDDILLSILPYPIKKIYLSLSRSKVIEKPILDETVRLEVIKELEDDINKLKNYTGCSFKNWTM